MVHLLRFLSTLTDWAFQHVGNWADQGQSSRQPMQGEQDLINLNTPGDGQRVASPAPAGLAELQLLSLLDAQPSGQAWQVYTPLVPFNRGEETTHLDSEAPQDDTSVPQSSLYKGKGKEPLYAAPADGYRSEPDPSPPTSPEDGGPQKPVHKRLSYVPAPAAVSSTFILSLHLCVQFYLV